VVVNRCFIEPRFLTNKTPDIAGVSAIYWPTHIKGNPTCHCLIIIILLPKNFCSMFYTQSLCILYSIIKSSQYRYSRSQSNVNVVYCNYKETNSSYNVSNSPQTLLIVGNTFKICLWNFEEACAFEIMAVVRSTNSPKILNITITVILHCNYTVNIS